jgi:hypothetical protein
LKVAKVVEPESWYSITTQPFPPLVDAWDPLLPPEPTPVAQFIWPETIGPVLALAELELGESTMPALDSAIAKASTMNELTFDENMPSLSLK